jgi:signal transduction histidine kinase
MPTPDLVSTTTTFALNRVNILVGRVFSISSAFTALETSLNAFGQNQVAEGQPALFALLIAIVTVQVANLINFWFFNGDKIWLRLQVFLVLFATLFWPLLYGGEHAQDTKPWVWWALGMAGIAAHLAFKPFVATAMILVFPTAWFFLRISDSGGNSSWQPALQDSIYTLLFSAAISSLVALLQNAASKVDTENQRATTIEVQGARSESTERERARVDALVHDKVLTTLLVAANSNSEEQANSATAMATAAIEALSRQELPEDRDTTSSSFFLSLKAAISRQSDQVVVEVGSTDDSAVGEQVALALSEATIQAVTNAIQHAGARAKCSVLMKSGPGGVKIVVKDDGRGFRMNRVPKNRLGLRLSIIHRVETVGGRVFIDSAPGRGTNVIIEWPSR